MGADYKSAPAAVPPEFSSELNEPNDGYFEFRKAKNGDVSACYEKVKAKNKLVYDYSKMI